MKTYTLKLAALAAFAVGASAPLAQASLHIDLTVDANTGGTVVTFSGTYQLSVPYIVDGNWEPNNGAEFNIDYPDMISIALCTADSDTIVYVFTDFTWSGTTPSMDAGWETNKQQPGSGAVGAGFGMMFDGGQKLYLLDRANSGGLIEWSGSFVIPQTMAGLGIVAGTSDVLVFRDETTGAEIVSISWSVAPVPEPSTYAAILGLGVVGVVLLRRRHKSVN